jgi:hypothetical protein
MGAPAGETIVGVLLWFGLVVFFIVFVVFVYWWADRYGR